MTELNADQYFDNFCKNQLVPFNLYTVCIFLAKFIANFTKDQENTMPVTFSQNENYHKINKEQ